MSTISARKLILCELLRLNFKHNNNIKKKTLRVSQIFLDRYSKEEFHILVKELKPFDHKFFFSHIATRHFDFSLQCFTVFLLFSNLLHLAMSLADNTME